MYGGLSLFARDIVGPKRTLVECINEPYHRVPEF